MAVSENQPRWKGIPYSDVSGSLDPRKVYESRAMSLASNSKPGLERFAYSVFGPSFIGSLAFALDPFSEIRFPTMQIAPMNRMVKINCIQAQSRGSQAYEYRIRCDRVPDTSTGDLQDFIGPFCARTSSTSPKATYISQPYISGVRSDTTIRTRPIGMKGGEFELFAPYLKSPERHNSDVTDTRYYFSPGAPKYMQGWEEKVTRGTRGIGPAFRVSQIDVDAMLTAERASFVTARNKYAFGMIRDAVPTNRKISVARNVGELRDLPMMLRKSVEFFRNPLDLLEKVNPLKEQGSQYLNVKFGWEATFRAVVDMLKAPEQIAKEVNYLIERNGFATTFRSKRKWIDSVPSIPVVFYDFYPRETYVGGGNPTRRECELRLAMNYTLKFPKIDIPRLREELLSQKWGLRPNPSDVYNLVPWTWLADWFGGLGDYIDVMNTLMDDPNLFNYGYLTYRSDARIDYLVRTQLHDTLTCLTEPPVVFVDRSKDRIAIHCSELGYKYQRRIDISSIAGVKSLSSPSTLGADQYAILGALLAGKT